MLCSYDLISSALITNVNLYISSINYLPIMVKGILEDFFADEVLRQVDTSRP